MDQPIVDPVSPFPHCQRCDAPLPAAAGGMHCPRCLMELAMGQGAASPVTPASAPAPNLEELQPLFPHHELQMLLGRGGMGFVYRARHRKLDRLVAIKVLRPDFATDPAFAERFEREARALAVLDHPGIVGIHDFGRTGEFFFLVMEYVDGANLRDLLMQGQLTARDVLSFVPQLCDALQFAHDRRIVHRDIKPENILIDQEGQVHIADFGLAKLLGDGTATYGLTQSDQAVGTPHYMAPEQVVASCTVDHRADLYSLGVVLYEMLTGTLPIGRFPLPSAKTKAAEAFDPVVMKSLENDPTQRYQQASEVKSDVQAAAKATDPTSGPNRKATAAKGNRRSVTSLRQHPSWSTYNLHVVIGCITLVATQMFILPVAIYLAWLVMSYQGLPIPGGPRDPAAPRQFPWAYVLGGVLLLVSAYLPWCTIDGQAIRDTALTGWHSMAWVPDGMEIEVIGHSGSIVGIPFVVVPWLGMLVALMGVLRSFRFSVPTYVLLGAQIVGTVLPLLVQVVCALTSGAQAGIGSGIAVLVFLIWMLIELQLHVAGTYVPTPGRSARRAAAH